jgi:hypothetical protein
LNTYPHLSGRLANSPKHGGSHVTNLDAGAEILEATSSQALDEISKGENVRLMDLPGEGQDLMVPYDPSNVPGKEQPVFTIQHTRFKCGAVALGIRILHCLNDGGGFFQLVNDLAKVYRSLNSESQAEPRLNIAAPYLVDYAMNATEAEKEDARRYNPTLYSLEQSEPETNSNSEGKEEEPKKGEGEGEAEADLAAPELPAPAPAPPPKTTGKVLHFTPSDLSRLKDRATPSPTSEGGYITTFDALTAHLHQRIYQARSRFYSSKHTELSPPDLLCPIDLRSLLKLSTPNPYVFNAVLTTSSAFPPSLLLSDDNLPEIATIIHNQVRPFASDKEAEKTARWIASVDQTKIRAPFRGGNASAMISQWNKMDMYAQAIFEEGIKPVLVAPPFTPISLHDGLGYTIPPRDGEGIDVYLALREEIWDELDVSC